MTTLQILKRNKSGEPSTKILSTKRKVSSKDMKESSFNNFGFEYDPFVMSDKMLLAKIIDSNNYLPKNEFIIDFNYEFSKIMVMMLKFF